MLYDLVLLQLYVIYISYAYFSCQSLCELIQSYLFIHL